MNKTTLAARQIMPASIQGRVDGLSTLSAPKNMKTCDAAKSIVAL